MQIKLSVKHFVVALPQLVLALLCGGDARRVEWKSNGGEPDSFVCDFRNVGNSSMGSPACFTAHNEMVYVQDLASYQGLCVRKDGNNILKTKEKASGCEDIDVCLSAEDPSITTAPEQLLAVASNSNRTMDGAKAHISLAHDTSAAGSASPYLGWVLIILAFVFVEMCRGCCSICRHKEEVAKSKPASCDLNVPCNNTATNKLDDTDMSDVHLENQ
jgi:hypothetical protein